MKALISLTDVTASLRRMPLSNANCLMAVRVLFFSSFVNSINYFLFFVKIQTGDKMRCITNIINCFTTIIKYIYKFFDIEQNKQQNEFCWKRKQLCVVYEKIVSLIEQCPDYSPNDILVDIDFAPHYSMEHFDSLFKSLDCQIENYKKQRLYSCSNEQKYDIDTQIQNREYAKNKIAEIKKQYYKAKKLYNLFCESYMEKFNLYAGQNVKNCFTKFNVTIKNVFLSGQLAEPSDSTNNIIKNAKQNLLISMREDLGIL